MVPAFKAGISDRVFSGCLAACGQTASYQNAKGSAAEYTPGQIMTVAATERNRYQNIYTGQLWSVAADGSGTTFESLLKGQMEQFLTELAAINLLAEEKGVELTNQEKTQVQSLTDTAALSGNRPQSLCDIDCISCACDCCTSAAALATVAGR